MLLIRLSLEIDKFLVINLSSKINIFKQRTQPSICFCFTLASFTSVYYQME